MPSTDTDQPDTKSTLPAGSAPSAADRRSPSLLPADDDADGRFAVAEEVSLDQQSDDARRIGALPPDPAPGAHVSEALAGTLAPPGIGQTAQHRPEGHAQPAPAPPDASGRTQS